MKNKKNYYKKKQQPPGTLFYTGDQSDDLQELHMITYNKDKIVQKKIESIDEFINEENLGIKWLDVMGLANIHSIEEIGQKLRIHRLILEDILNTRQRAKLEEYDDSLFLVIKKLSLLEDIEIDAKQISIIIKENMVITFQEYNEDAFKPIRKRLEEGAYVRALGADDLTYALIDSVVDGYFDIMETLSEEIDRTENELMDDPGKGILNRIYSLKRQIVFFRNTVWPVRDIANTLSRGEIKLIDQKTSYYFRDIYDHSIQVIELIETYRDTISGMMDIYLSSISSKTNEVMKILTIFSTIFIPLTFLAGVYGMNFIYFPELKWKYGYLGFWIVSILITAAMIKYLKSKKWM
ncbi:MAG TPA: magnesium/cobalt transporter CorA [Soehngenia sp.]|nr:magnesium/cobalt transporter CorA [Soehngenia sp.]HPP31422.1 magnesium/cobalt transporter CorA [Soehngenia sp.]